MRTFYVVLRDPDARNDGGRQNIVTKTYDDEHRAAQEARRLSGDTGVAFYVMKSVGVAVRPPAPTVYSALEDEPDAIEQVAPQPETRPCPACGAALKGDETHWSIYPSPMGGYVCPPGVTATQDA